MDEQTILILAILGGLLLICVLVIAAFLICRTVSATIAGFSWFRKIFFEHYIWVQDTSFSGFPDGSRNQDKKLEGYQSYEHVRTETTTSTINGQTTTTSQPVYENVTRWRTKYTYEIQRWMPSRELEAKGQERADLHWPAYKLDHSNQERINKSRERYRVFFQTAKGKKYKRELAETEWADLDDQSVYLLKINLFGQVKRISSGTQQLIEMPEQIS